MTALQKIAVFGVSEEYCCILQRLMETERTAWLCLCPRVYESWIYCDRVHAQCEHLEGTASRS